MAEGVGLRDEQADEGVGEGAFEGAGAEGVADDDDAGVGAVLLGGGHDAVDGFGEV